MIYKLIADEKGNYQDSEGNKYTLLEAMFFIDTPQGRNYDCLEFENIEEAESHYNITKIEEFEETLQGIE